MGVLLRPGLGSQPIFAVDPSPAVNSQIIDQPRRQPALLHLAHAAGRGEHSLLVFPVFASPVTPITTPGAILVLIMQVPGQPPTIQRRPP